MAIISSNPAMDDLKITFKESTLVFPSQLTQKQSIFLCNIDQFLNYSIPTVSFFSANPDYPPELVSKKLKLAVEKVLVPYDFMAGRLKLNQETFRLEIDCNAAGAGFVVGSSEYSLHELGDLVCPNLGFRQLAVQTLELLDNINDGQPLFILQVTSFKCGGFAIGMSVNHILLDGLSAKTFNENLASQAFDDKPLATIPFLNRRLLTARSPPLVEFSHPEFFKPDNLPDSGPAQFNCKKEELVSKVLKLNSSDINFLKNKAEPNNGTRISSYSATAALIWRCKALSNSDGDTMSTLLNVVDLRSRMNPPLPPSYCGNAVLVSYSSEERKNIEKDGAFSKLAEMVSVEPKSMTDKYAKSAIDWLEINRGVPRGEYVISSWLRLGFEKVEYPWGKPIHSGPLVNHRKDICWVFPTLDGSINALASLPPKEMELFQSQFHNFFA